MKKKPKLVDIAVVLEDAADALPDREFDETGELLPAKPKVDKAEPSKRAERPKPGK